METYFKFKLTMEIIPIIIFVALCVLGVATYTKEHFVKKFFLSHGYERELLDVSSCGDGAFYGWVRKSDNRIVDDRDIAGWSLRKIKKEYK